MDHPSWIIHQPRLPQHDYKRRYRAEDWTLACSQKEQISGNQKDYWI
ncbi:hypothetical protein [Coleofasciculus chthonoplastes]